MAKKKNEKIIDYQSLADNLAQENTKLHEALLRERADAENVRRRAELDKLQMTSYIKSNIIQDLLPVIDNFERALINTPKDLENNQFIKGVESVVKQFSTTLEKLGVERIKTVGEEFNPHFHEAVSHEDGDGKREEVVEELQSGYKIGDQVVRHAMVRVKS